MIERAVGLVLIVLFHQLFFLAITSAIYNGGNMKIRLYKSGSTEYDESPIEQGEVLFINGYGYNKTLPLVLIVHGMAEGADCDFVVKLVDAFVKRGLTTQYNIMAVDMPEMLENSIRNDFYFGVLANVEPAGEMIGKFFKKTIQMNLIKPEDINMIGYSIGAQIAGYAARLVKRTYGPISFIAGLDPAGPGFHPILGRIPSLTHVSANDASLTHFYHTNSVNCGTTDRVATADFVFNKGTIQPGCTKDATLDCSHVRVPLLYIEAVAQPRKFVARKCSNWVDFRSCTCNSHETVFITFPPDKSARGIHYLRTHAKTPFGMGMKGSRCPKIVHAVHVANISTPKTFKEAFRDIIKPKNKLNDNINMHLINGIRKMEDFHRQVDDIKKSVSQKEGKAREFKKFNDSILKQVVRI